MPMMTAFTRRQGLGGLAVMMGAILVATALAHAAKCIPDPDSASYQDPSAPGYNDQYLIDVVHPQLAGEPYFGVAMNTPPLSSGDSSLRRPDTARNETIPPQSWWRPAVELSWNPVSATAQYRLKLEDPPYHNWIAYDKSWFNETSRTVPNEASMQRWWVVQYRNSDDDTPKTLARIFIRCGVEVVGVPAAGLQASFTSTPIAPHVSTGEPGYGDRYLAWNREVDRILAERQGIPPTTVLPAPQNLRGVGEDGAVWLTWDAPRSNGGAPITGYQYRIDGSGDWISIGSTETTHTISGLRNGKTYVIELRAVNAEGTGAAAKTSATPWSKPENTPPGNTPPEDTPVATVPAAPAAPTLMMPDNGGLAVAWTAPDNDGGSVITGYTLQWTLATDSGFVRPVGSANVTGTAHTITGLTNGAAYAVRVQAVNSQGPGAWSPAGTATPATVPAAPVAPTLMMPDNGTLAVAWTAPDNDGGSVITGYTLQWTLATDSGFVRPVGSANVTGTAHTITGLTNGAAYAVRVQAVNSQGPGAWSSAGTATPATVPAAPAALALTPDNGTLAAAWSAPDNDGGSVITGYTLQWTLATDSGFVSPLDSADVTGTARTITGLTNGAAYAVRVQAVNAQGPGAWSPAAVETPAASVPAAPAALALAPVNGTLAVAWTVPNDGGSAITGYTVQWTLATDSGFVSPLGSANVTGTAHIITGLTNGTAYAVRVQAVNAQGPGAWSPAAVETPVSTVSETPSAWRWGWRHWGGWWPRMQ